MNGLKNIRNNLKKGALFRKYFFFTAAVVIACVVVLGIVLMIFTAVQWWNEKIDILTENAKYIVGVAVETKNENPIDDNGEYRNDLKDVLEVIAHATASDYFLVDTNGNVTVCKDYYGANGVNGCDEHGNMVIPENYMSKALKNGFSNYATDDVFGLGKFVVAVPINIDGRVTGAVFAVEDAITGLLPYILSILKTFLITATIGLLLCFIIIYFSCKSITTPISEMQEVTKHFAKGEFNHRANENYKNEYLCDFARALNKMADELAVEEEAQKSFVANVSHELKTPMTTIGGF
ncbi:MAG: hypothetical protein ACI4W6_05050, partial [Acutalibacteraceae bacterium]